MARTDIENATIQQALVFYQQHLVAERQKHESHLPRNGKLAVTPEDVARENTYERELQTITALLETRQGDAMPALEAEAMAKSTFSVSPLFKRQEPDTEPYINPITGQWIFPETKFTPGPSKSTSLSDEWGLVDVAKSLAITDDAPSFKATELDAPSATLKPEGARDDAPMTGTQSKGSKSSLIKRKPVNSTQHIKRCSVPPPPGPWLHPTKAPVSADAFATPLLSSKQATASTPLVNDVKKESKEGPSARSLALSMPGQAASMEAVVNSTSLDSTGTMLTEGQIQRRGGSFNDQETPWAFVTNPTETAPRCPCPPMQPPTPPSRETSWQSATWTHIMSTSQKPATPISLRSQQSREATWNQVPPMQLPKVTDSDNTVFSQQYHNASRSSVSAEELKCSDSSDIQHRSQPSWSSTHQAPAVTNPEVRFRTQPTFNTAGFGKFGEFGGGKSSPPLHVFSDAVSSRFPSANGSVVSFSSEGRPQPMLSTRELSKFPNDQGSGRTFPSDGSRQPQFYTSVPGRFPNDQGNGRGPASPAGRGELGLRPRPSRAELSNASSFLSLPRFASDSVPQQSFSPANVMPNDPRQAFSDPVRPNYAGQFPGFNGNPNQNTQAKKIYGIGDNAMGLASRPVQQSTSFGEASGPNTSTSPIVTSYSAPFATDLLPFHEHQSNPTKPTKDVSQGYYIPSKTELPSWLSVQAAQSVDTGWGLPKTMPQERQAFGPSGGQNVIMPNELKQGGSKPDNHFDAGQRQSSMSSQAPHSFNPLGSPNGTVPNQLMPSVFETRSHLDAGTSAPSTESRSQHNSASFGGQNGIIPNQLRPSGPKARRPISVDHHEGQPMEHDWKQPKNRSTSTQPTSQQDDFQIAQSIAERADHNEIAALQRMQDEFNRQDEIELAEQEAFARRVQDSWNAPSAANSSLDWQQGLSLHFQHQPSSRSDRFTKPATAVQGRNPPQWRPSQLDTGDDDVQFAPALEDDIHPGVVVKPPMITASTSASQPEPQRTSNPQLTKQTNGTFDAANAAAEEIAKYEATQRALEESAKQSALDKVKAAQAAAKANSHSNQLECTACGDKDSASAMAVLPCGHAYCSICVADAFKHALAAGKVFICCNKTPAPIEVATQFLPFDFVTQYRVKMEERATLNPIYCAKPGCAAFIPPSNLKGPMATCGKCGFVSCSLCKNPEHKGVCPPDQLGLKLMNLAGNKNWIQCTRCKAVVERDEGCLHMTCTCGHEFCYSCGGKWDQCGGKCPRRNKL